MASEKLANKYRPDSWEDVVEQTCIKQTIENQLNNNTFTNCYLFIGSAGTGKTTSARLFAKAINKGSMNSVIEIDAASNSKVESVRELVEQSKYKPMDADYKVYIIDEVHALSKASFQALLKCLEEPTPTTVFIMCTTDVEKVPDTIISRAEKHIFTKISTDGITNRLKYIIDCENKEGANITYDDDAIKYIAKISEGGMRLAITNLEQTISYNNNITIESVSKSIGLANYEIMFNLTDNVLKMNVANTIKCISDVYMSGVDISKFIDNYTSFVVDLCKFNILKSFDYVQFPNTFTNKLEGYTKGDYDFFIQLMDSMIKLRFDIKNESNPRPIIEAQFILLCCEG